MMNEARLGVGVQGLALSEVAYQNAASLREGAAAGPRAHRRRSSRTSPPTRSSCIPTCAAC